MCFSFDPGLINTRHRHCNSLWTLARPRELSSAGSWLCPNPNAYSATSCAHPMSKDTHIWRKKRLKYTTNLLIKNVNKWQNKNTQIQKIMCVCVTCMALYSPSLKLRRGVRKWMLALWTNFLFASPTCFWASPHLSSAVPEHKTNFSLKTRHTDNISACPC